MSTLKDLQDKMDALKAEVLEESKKLLKNESANIFEKYSDLSYFSWTQYTPYFNDGDTCEFGVNSALIVLNGATEEEVEDSWSGDIVGESEQSEEIEKAVTNLLDTITEDFYKEMFGDHCEVKVSRDGVCVSEYDHD